MVWMDAAPHTEQGAREERESAFDRELTWLEMRCDKVEAAIRNARRKGEGDELENEWGYHLSGVGCAPAAELTDQEAG